MGLTKIAHFPFLFFYDWKNGQILDLKMQIEQF